MDDSTNRESEDGPEPEPKLWPDDAVRGVKYPARRDPSTEDLKSDLNDLLVSALPGSTELRVLDDIAMDVVEAVDHEWDRHEREHPDRE